VVFFADGSGKVPLLDWLDGLPKKVQDKFIVRIGRLEECGHELRRPEADKLRDGVYELRVRHKHVNYRLLYFFHERRAVLAHGIVKEGEVPDREIDQALRRRIRFELHPETHTYRE
jgi:phage-related protein